MDTRNARSVARELMDTHGLSEWSFRFDRARRRAGSCIHATRTITLSAPLVRLYDEPVVVGVILHEIAHALVGPAHQHDQAWKATARRIGAPDSARLPSTLPSPEAPWVGTCPRCGHQRRLFSAPRRVSSCAACSSTFHRDLVFTWEYRGHPRLPGGAYERELSRIRRSR